MQTKLSSITEAFANVILGYLVAVTANYFVLPLFGYDVSMLDSAGIGIIFSMISIIRSYLLRRLFNAKITKKYNSRLLQTSTEVKTGR
jgi:hypothetical protein